MASPLGPTVPSNAFGGFTDPGTPPPLPHRTGTATSPAPAQYSHEVAYMAPSRSGEFMPERTSSSEATFSKIGRKQSLMISESILPEVEEIRSQCRSLKTIYIDFINKDEVNKYDWRSVLMDLRPPRPHKEWCVIDPERGIDPGDIMQGELGDCWFTSSVAVLAYRHPELITDLFLVTEVNPEGVFAVKLHIDGAWKPYIIDGTFPTVHGGSHLKFSYCKQGNCLWVPLLEKAYAKARGGYEALVSGHIGDALTDLTGFPTVRISNDRSSGADGWDQQEVIAQMTSYITADCVMGASCGRSGIEHVAKDMGLVTNHAYSVLALGYCRDRRAHMIQLRNPWGKSDCRGERPPAAGNIAGTPTEGPGCFWLTFDQFSACFGSVVICRTREYQTQLGIENIRCSPQSNFLPPPATIMSDLTIHLQRTAQVFIMASQGDNRLHKGRLYFDISFIVLQHLPRGGFRVRKITDSTTERDTCIEVLLDEGMYSVVPLSFNGDRHINITILSESEAIVQRPFGRKPSALPPSPDPARILYEAITSHPKVTMKPLISNTVSFYALSLGVVHLFAAMNASSNWYANFELNLSGAKGVSTVRDPQNRSLDFVQVMVPPRSGCFLAASVAHPNNGSYSVQFRYQFQCNSTERPQPPTQVPLPCFELIPL